MESVTLPKTLNTSMIIVILSLLFVVPQFVVKPINNTFFERMKVFYGSINMNKAPLILIISLSISIISTIGYNMLLTDKTKYILKPLYTIIYVALIGFILYYLPKHCALGTCIYNKVTEKDLSKSKNINFFGVGDFQNDHYQDGDSKNSSKYINRRAISAKYISSINELVKKFKNNNLDNIILDNLDETDKNHFLEVMKDDVIGLATAGDCVQKPNDGRANILIETLANESYRNNMGAYENMLANNPEDGGMLDIPSFECLGNHDFDTQEIIHNEDKDTSKDVIVKNDLGYKFDDKSPMEEMQLRRNQYRKYVVNKDEHGNYSCDWGGLHVLFLNVWPSRYNLINGEPKGSVDFLIDDLKIHGHKSWMVMTHYAHYGKTWTSWYKGNPIMEDFGKIYEQYKDTCLGIMYGHVHSKFGMYRNMLGCDYHLLPAPAAYDDAITKEYEIALFSYNQELKEKTIYTIKCNEINDVDITYTIEKVTID